MKKRPLGRTGIDVSEYCLGTMTWGVQTAEADGHAQIDRALDAGIDFMDTAEMYPVNPVRAETVGRTEEIIGNWNAKTGRRKDWVIATKCSGYNERFVRQGQPVTGATVREALEGSLRRLQTDYIDLYQLHWPDRGSFQFRQNWNFDPSKQDPTAVRDNLAEISTTLKDCVAEGKIRAWGLSNESTWGTMEWLRAAEQTGGPRVATVQNEYSLMFRIYDTDMAEMSANEDVTLLAWSPLACGMLSGKYQGGAIPSDSRMGVGGGDLGGRATERAFVAIDAYLDIAARHGIDPVHMALAWTLTRPFPIIPIFGATNMDQLEKILSGVDVTLSDEVLAEISATHRAHPMPY
ncbi:MAG: aldo/keto reductase [Pseudomonadota bacterium]